MKKVEIFTDGACSGNPGIGGWGSILRFNGQEKEISGAQNPTTNNRMELMAAIEGLKSLKEPCAIDLTTDSQYVKNGITQWIFNWKRNNWRKSDNKPVLNFDLWLQLDELSKIHQIKWHWVKGHTGHIENERCDALARKAIEQYRTEN